MEFRESGFSFEFPLSWIVLKFDEHRFYKYLAGDGFKAVDFLCLTPTGELHFLEIKNYLDTFPADGIHPSAALKTDPIIYADDYWKKYLDSLYLIELIHKFYRRKTWYRMALKLGFEKWSFFRKKEWVRWTQFYRIIKNDSKTNYFDLWIEIDDQKFHPVKTILDQIEKDLQEKNEEAQTEVNIYHSKSPGYLVARPFHS